MPASPACPGSGPEPTFWPEPPCTCLDPADYTGFTQIEPLTPDPKLACLDPADEDEEGDSAQLAAQLEAELAAAAQQAQQEAAAAARATAGAAGGQQGPWVLAPVSEATADLLFSGQQVDWEAAEPAAVAAARLASGGWSRVIRTPRKRSGHVVLDLCSAAPPAEGGRQPGGGQRGGFLVRQVVSRAAARRDAGGTAAYRLARNLRWGDLWPLDYQARFRTAEPPAGQGLGQE